MKKEYTAPVAEKVNFNYKDQVVASNAGDVKSACWWVGQASFGFAGCLTTDVGGSANNVL